MTAKDDDDDDDDARLLPSSSLDFVYSRFLLCDMQDWPEYVSDIFTILKLGCWAEMCDFVEDVSFTAEGLGLATAPTGRRGTEGPRFRCRAQHTAIHARGWVRRRSDVGVSFSVLAGQGGAESGGGEDV